LRGDEGNDTLYGEGESDVLVGGDGDDYLDGGDGNNVLDGNSGNDTLIGSMQIDFLHGGAGDDLIDSGVGGDFITGGSGRDRFILESGGFGADIIFDFEDGLDRLVLRGGLTFDQLSFSSEGEHTLITLSTNNQPLVALLGVQMSLISIADFISQ